MNQTIKTAPMLLCPSIISIGPDAQVFGVLTGSLTEDLQVGYLTEALPATPELLAAAAPAKRPRCSEPRHPVSSGPATF